MNGRRCQKQPGVSAAGESVNRLVAERVTVPQVVRLIDDEEVERQRMRVQEFYVLFRANGLE